MKKRTILLLSFLSLCLSSLACAEEMEVRLKSGDRILIRYSGSIQEVSLDGKDSIQAISQPAGTKRQGAGPAPQASNGKQPSSSEADGKKRDGSWFRFGWAEPKGED